MNLDKGQCFMSGYCCTVGVCSYGVWNKDKHQCQHLDEPNDKGQRVCLIADDINKTESNSKHRMFGSGCSSTMFNTARDILVRGKR